MPTLVWIVEVAHGVVSPVPHGIACHVMKAVHLSHDIYIWMQPQQKLEQEDPCFDIDHFKDTYDNLIHVIPRDSNNSKVSMAAQHHGVYECIAS